MQNPPLPLHTKSSVHEAYVQYHKLMFQSYHLSILMDPSRYKKSESNSQKIRNSRFHKLSTSNNKLKEFNNLSQSSIYARTEMSSMVKESYFHDFTSEKNNNSNEIINQNELDSSQLDLKKKKPYQKDQFLSTQPILTNLNESVDEKMETMKSKQKLITEQEIKNQTKSQLVTRKKQQQISQEKLDHAKQNINLSSITQNRSNGLSQSEKNPSQSSSNRNVKSKILKSSLFDADDNCTQSRASSTSGNLKGASTQIIKLSGNHCEENKPLLKQSSQANQNKIKDSSYDSYEKDKSSSQSSQQIDYEQKINTIKHTQSQITQKLKQTSLVQKKSQQIESFKNQTMNVKKSKAIENQHKVLQSKGLKKQSDSQDGSNNSSDYDSKIINQKPKPKVQQLNSAIIPTKLQLKKDQIKKQNNRYDSNQQWTSSEQQEQQKQLNINKHQNKQQIKNQQKTQITLLQAEKVPKEKQDDQNEDQDSDENEDYENIVLKKTGSQKQNSQMFSEKVNKQSIEQQVVSKEQTQNLSLKGTGEVVIENHNNLKETTFQNKDNKSIRECSSSSSQGSSSENEDYHQEKQEKSLSERVPQSYKPKQLMNVQVEQQHNDTNFIKAEIGQQEVQGNHQKKIENFDEKNLSQVGKQQELIKEGQPAAIYREPLQDMCESKIGKSMNQRQGRTQFSNQIKQNHFLISANSLESLLTTTLANAIIPNLTQSIVSSLRQSLKQQISQQVKAHNELLYYQLKDCLLEQINQKFKAFQHFIADEIRVSKKNFSAILLKQSNSEEQEEDMPISLQKEQIVQCLNRNQSLQNISKIVEQQSPIQVCENKQQPSCIKQSLKQISNTQKQNEAPLQQKEDNIKHSLIQTNVEQQFIPITKLKEQLSVILKTQISKEIKSTIQNEVRQVFKEEFNDLIKRQIKEQIHQQLSYLFPKVDVKNYDTIQKVETLQQQNKNQNQPQAEQSILHQEQRLSRIDDQILQQSQSYNLQQDIEKQIQVQSSYVQEQQPDRFKLESQLSDRSYTNEMSQFQKDQCFQAPSKDSIESYEQEQQQQSEQQSDN